MSHPCGGYSDLFYFKSPRKAGVVVKALEGREERQCLDLRRCSFTDLVQVTPRRSQLMGAALSRFRPQYLAVSPTSTTTTATTATTPIVLVY